VALIITTYLTYGLKPGRLEVGLHLDIGEVACMQKLPKVEDNDLQEHEWNEFARGVESAKMEKVLRFG